MCVCVINKYLMPYKCSLISLKGTPASTITSPPIITQLPLLPVEIILYSISCSNPFLCCQGFFVVKFRKNCEKKEGKLSPLIPLFNSALTPKHFFLYFFGKAFLIYSCKISYGIKYDFLFGITNSFFIKIFPAF